MFSDPQIIIAITATMMMAGMVKGVIGLGLPTIGLGILTAVIGLHDAIILMLVPSFVTNSWQVVRGGDVKAVLKRIWPILISSMMLVWVGVLALSRVDITITTSILGALLVLYGAFNLHGFQWSISKPREFRTGIGIGIINGIVTGMTGSLGIPGVLFLQAIGLDRQQLMQSMGLLFVSSTIMLAIILPAQNMFSVESGVASIFTVVPTLAGMMLGIRLRDRLSEAQFRKVFFSFIMLLGFYIVMRAMGVM